MNMVNINRWKGHGHDIEQYREIHDSFAASGEAQNPAKGEGRSLFGRVSHYGRANERMMIRKKNDKVLRLEEASKVNLRNASKEV
jgi:hypothetical protein